MKDGDQALRKSVKARALKESGGICACQLASHSHPSTGCRKRINKERPKYVFMHFPSDWRYGNVGAVCDECYRNTSDAYKAAS